MEVSTNRLIKLTAPEDRVELFQSMEERITLVCLENGKLEVAKGVLQGLPLNAKDCLVRYSRDLVNLWLGLRFGSSISVTHQKSLQLWGLAIAVGETQIQMLVPKSLCEALADAQDKKERWELLKIFASHAFSKKEKIAQKKELDGAVKEFLRDETEPERQLQTGIWLIENRFAASRLGVRDLFRALARDDVVKDRANYQLALCLLQGIDGECDKEGAMEHLLLCGYGFAPAHLLRLRLGVDEKSALHILGMFEGSTKPSILFACARLAEHYSSQKIRDAGDECQKRACSILES